MEKKAYFLKCLSNGAIIPITDQTRRYSENIVKKRGDHVLLDEDYQIIGNLELNPSEAEVFVEEKIKDLIERETRVEIREIAIAEKEQEFKEKVLIFESKAVSEVVKVDKRRKEFKEN